MKYGYSIAEEATQQQILKIHNIRPGKSREDFYYTYAW